MKRKIVKVSLSFASFNNDQFNSFVILLLVCLKTNPLFPNLPVKYADLAALVDVSTGDGGGGHWRPQGHRRAE